MGQVMGRLHGKVAIVTGGASGIGSSMSRLFASEGAAVAIADVNGVAGEALAAEIRHSGAEVAFHEMNVADSESVAAAVDRIRSNFGRIDIYVNNAGIGSQSSGDAAGWWRLLRINLLGVAWGTREAVAAMRESGGGSIVNTGSHAGQRSARAGVYGCSKAAVHTLTRYAALAHAPDRVRVNAVLPGNIYTPIHDLRRHEALVRLMEGDSSAFAVEPLDQGEDPAEAREQLIRAFAEIHPMGRLATEQDIAEAALFLASDAAGAATGNEFIVNGGIMAKLLRDRLVEATEHPPAVPPPSAPARPATTALVSANSAMIDALVGRFERAGLPVAVSPDPLCANESIIVEWLASLGPLAGIVFAMRPDQGGDLFTQRPADWEAELAADFRLPWVLTHVAAEMLPAGAAVTFVADASGLTGAASSPAYCCSAAALIYSAELFADQLRTRGIKVNTVVAEAIRESPGVAALGAPSSRSDIAEVAFALARSTSLTGLQVSLETSHPFDRAML
jgi:NAD(P)-dependent dehydrogenase (short-subunit alcohol dehydrogenase family)